MTATYSFWLAEKAVARIPELKEVKDDVILYWKQQKALKAAMADAESIAREINDSNQQTLVGKFPEKAVSTGEFTWFSMAGGETTDFITEWHDRRRPGIYENRFFA